MTTNEYGYEVFMTGHRIKSPSVTELGTYNDCPRKALLTARGGLNLTRNGHKSSALEFGSLWHFAMAMKYSGAASWKQIGEIINVAKGDYNQTDWADDFRAVLSHYAMYWQGRDFINVLGTEILVEYRMPRGRIIGRIDGLLENYGKLWIIEHKTARATSNVYDVAEFNMQSLIYMLAVRQKYGKPVGGVIYNAVSKSVPQFILNKDGSISKSSSGTSVFLRKEAEKAGITGTLPPSLDDAKYFNRFAHEVSELQLEIFSEKYLPSLYSSMMTNKLWRYQWNPIGCSYCGVKSICRLMNQGASNSEIVRHINNEYTERSDHKPQEFAQGRALFFGDNPEIYWVWKNEQLVSGSYEKMLKVYNG